MELLTFFSPSTVYLGVTGMPLQHTASWTGNLKITLLLNDLNFVCNDNFSFGSLTPCNALAQMNFVCSIPLN